MPPIPFPRPNIHAALSLKAKGEECDLQKIKDDIEQRDYQDMHRDISPLKQADDAVLVDSSDMGIDEVVEAIKTVINKAK